MRAHGTTATRPAEMFADWRLAVCNRCQSPATSRSSPGQGAPRLSRRGRPGVVLGAEHLLGPSLDARVDSQCGSFPRLRAVLPSERGRWSAEPRSGQRDRHASALCASGSGPRRGRSRPGRCPHTAPCGPATNIVAPRMLAVKSSTTADQPPPRIPVGCEMDDHQDHAEDPDRRMTQDLDTPEM